MRFSALVLLCGCSATYTEPPRVPTVALGAFILDRTPPIDGAAPMQAQAMTNYAAMVRGRPAILMWYVKWSGRAFPAHDAQRVTDFGAMPMITWEACNTVRGGPCQTTTANEYSDANIARGFFDQYIRAWAQGAKAWGKPFLLRPMHEMNGNWYPWSTGANNPNHNTPDDYIAAWKHVHAIFDAVGVSNAMWVWSPNAGLPLAADYPGDDVVDWVALDGYNWGSLQGGWTSFRELFEGSYTEMLALTHKPLMIAETGCAPGDKANWIDRAFLEDVPTRFPNVRAVVWFDMNKETDWRVNSDPASLAAWLRVTQSVYYQSGWPPRVP